MTVKESTLQQHQQVCYFVSLTILIIIYFSIPSVVYLSTHIRCFMLLISLSLSLDLSLSLSLSSLLAPIALLLGSEARKIASGCGCGRGCCVLFPERKADNRKGEEDHNN